MDRVSITQRSENMRRVRAKNTAPELAVRRMLHAMGLRFRLHRTDLPGKPDIVLPRHSLVVFVHGCFWHRHEQCVRCSTPATRQEFWLPKFAATVERDRKNIRSLEEAGWKVLTIWECEIKNAEQIEHFVQLALRANPKAVHRHGNLHKTTSNDYMTCRP